jgi:hypothetical protein
MTEINNSESEEFIIQDNEKKTRLLFFLSFVISNEKYASSLKLLAPGLKKFLAKFPTPAEFKAASKLVKTQKFFFLICFFFSFLK